MAELRLRAAARADLVAIDDYSALQFGQQVAEAYTRGIRDAFQLLRDHPMAGAAQPKLGSGVRSLTHRQHRIIYLVEGDLVLIVRVVHHAMDARKALKQ
jgi:toxin ParE1/3/4